MLILWYLHSISYHRIRGVSSPVPSRLRLAWLLPEPVSPVPRGGTAPVQAMWVQTQSCSLRQTSLHLFRKGRRLRSPGGSPLRPDASRQTTRALSAAPQAGAERLAAGAPFLKDN